MSTPVSQSVLDQLFEQARSHNAWQPREVPDRLLHRLYEVLRNGPTGNNCCPARFVFVRSEEAKARLLPALKGHNVDKVQAAPVTVIVAYDRKFYEFLPELFPVYDAAAPLRANPQLAEQVALRNGSLQGAYLMLAARALGLDCGPMSGFDSAQVDATFFADGCWKSNFLCALGYGEAQALRPRGLRLGFELACQLV